MDIVAYVNPNLGSSDDDVFIVEWLCCPLGTCLLMLLQAVFTEAACRCPHDHWKIAEGIHRDEPAPTVKLEHFASAVLGKSFSHDAKFGWSSNWLPGTTHTQQVPRTTCI